MKFMKNQGVSGVYLLLFIYFYLALFFILLQFLLLYMTVVLMVIVVAMLKSNLERIPKQNVYMHIKKNPIPPCWAGPLARVHMKNFHLTWVGSRQNQVRSHLGGLAHFLYEHIMIL